ncbi:hypothetical protein P9112_002899 [Eukaryota sp. TZLM1-RC]
MNECLFTLGHCIPPSTFTLEDTHNVVRISQLARSIPDLQHQLITSSKPFVYEKELVERLIYKCRNAHKSWPFFKKLLRVRQVLVRLEKLDLALLLGDFAQLLTLPETNVPLTVYPLPSSDLLFYVLFKHLHFVYLLSELNVACCECAKSVTIQLQTKHFVHLLLTVLSSVSALYKCIEPLSTALDEIYSKLCSFRKSLVTPESSVFDFISLKVLTKTNPSELYHWLIADRTSNLFNRFRLFFDELKKKPVFSEVDIGSICQQ